MSAMPPNLIVPEEDTLNELYETVLRGFLPSPSPSTESTYSRGAYSAYPESAIDAESPVAEASGSTRHQFGKSCSGPLERVPDKVAANTPPSLSRSTSAQAAPLPNGISSSPAPARRRPLPPTPASSSRTPLQPPQIQPPPIFRPGPSSYDPPRTQQRPLSRKLSRNYSQSNLPQVVAPETMDEDGAGPSSTENEAEVPTSPTTEYPDHGAFLPSYYQSAHEDPNASASLEFAPPVGGDYTELPPPQTYEESVISDGTSIHQRYHGVESGERWNSGPEASTVLSGEYPMLQRPRSDASDFPRNIYEEPQEEPPQPYQPDPPEWNRNLRHSNDVVDIGPNPVRGNTVDSYSSMWDAGEPGDLDRRNTNVIRLIANFESRMHLELHEEEEEDPYEVDERRFVNMALLSNLAVQLRDKVPRGTHVKGSIPYPRAFTGKDIVSTLHSIIQRELLIDSGISHADRRAALLVARSLHGALFFYEVEWDDQDGGSEAPIERAELPTGIVTVLTKCYSASCDGPGCYAYSCPRRGLQQLPSISETPVGAKREEWTKKVPQQVLASLSESEINRQTIIHKLISKEQQYIQDLDILEAVFINPLRLASPPVMTPLILEEFIEEVFGNILELRECNRRLLDVMYVRQREQYPVIQSVGDIFLGSATEFRTYYPDYVGHHPLAEKRMKEELEHNPEFRLFIEKCSRELSSRSGASGTPRLDLKHYLNRPAEHLQKYPVLLDAVYRETQPSNPDGDYLAEAIAAIQNLQDVARLRTFQSAMGKGSTAKCEWHDLLSPDMRQMFTEEESKRQSVIFELIKGEMAYVRDLENIETMYVRPLRNAEPPIIPSDRLEQFLMDVFHNYHELYGHHRRLVDNLHEIQREEHPRIRSITAAVFDAVLNFRESYMEYIPNYPIAAYRIDDEMASNEAFRQFVNHTTRHPDAHRLDMKNFINRPIPRLLRYELLLKSILSETPPSHRDRQDIPPVIELIKALGKETEPGVASSKQKVELWKHNSNLIFKTGEYVDMDLLNEQRSLIHTGKLLRQPDSGLEWSGWTELFVMLFDNYLVMTKPRERDGAIKYHVYRRVRQSLSLQRRF
ncbi:hypothetical protein NLJ89_g4518 [Agrocybe chaxingu]|uniref:DH domain-containing protein n=1 Tax=Agrocybe chaxingu TaxID=84603 RepID=A0A9W8K9K9_9AGAR|nr:hypothetical protein NLJ89_g4518 [Agrocybe chaxingu]